jgi:hypothetical protein
MNLLTLTFLLGLLAADGDEPQAKPAPPAVPQDPDRPAITATDLKALRDTNIFAPKSIKRRPPPVLPTNSRNLPPTPYKQKPPVVTAIFLDLASQTHQVIVEDRNDSTHRYFKEPKFMKAGDEWAGVKVESVTQESAVFNRAGVSKEVHLGEALPESEAKPLSSADGSDEGIGDDGETPLPSESSTTSPSTSKFRKAAPESKTQTSEEQNKVLEDMRRKNKKKNRPGADE